MCDLVKLRIFFLSILFRYLLNPPPPPPPPPPYPPPYPPPPPPPPLYPPLYPPFIWPWGGYDLGWCCICSCRGGGGRCGFLLAASRAFHAFLIIPAWATSYVIAIIWLESPNSEQRDEKVTTNLFRLHTMFDTLYDRCNDSLEVSFSLIIPEPQHFPSIPLLIPNDFYNSIIILFSTSFPPTTSPSHISVSFTHTRAQDERERESGRTSPKFHHRLPWYPKNGSLRDHDSSITWKLV